MAQVSISQGCRVILHFTLMLDDGAIIDSNADKAPASLVIGDGSLPHGFESVLMGLSAGDEYSAMVEPEAAFGMPNPANIQTIPRKAFSPNLNLKEGLVVSFSDAARSEFPGVILYYDEQDVKVNFNHPLAGKDLLFDVHVVEVTKL